MKAHLLHAAEDFDFARGLPVNHADLVNDLELDWVLDAMAAGDASLREVATKVLLASSADPVCIRYRQQILADCMNEPDVARQLYDLAGQALAEKRALWGYSTQYPSSILASSISKLEVLVGWLKRLRHLADEHAARFRSDGFAALFGTVQHELDDAYFETVAEHLKQLRFPSGMVVSTRLGPDNSGVDFVLRSPDRNRTRWKEQLGIAPRTAYSFSIPARDEAGEQALAEITGRGLNAVANAVAQSADHITSYFGVLHAELGFYVACLNLRDRLSGKGAPVAFPVPAPWRPAAFCCASLRDVALTLHSDQPVVGNDVDADGANLVIVTGTNSGGKTTFLRSVGQAQLMLQCGMFVVADSYCASLYDGIYTHFVREEDAAMVSGRLDEELARMSAVADQIHSRCLLLFNESFAATNEREGSEIARQVVRALREAAIRMFFVTHQFDFARSFWAERSNSTVFLRAERERTFHLEPAGPLPTSFGEDLYDRLGGWLDEPRPHGQTRCSEVL